MIAINLEPLLKVDIPDELSNQLDLKTLQKLTYHLGVVFAIVHTLVDSDVTEPEVEVSSD